MNKSDCCNAEVEQNENYAYYCSECGRFQDIPQTKPKQKVTKYYQVTGMCRKSLTISVCVIVASRPDEAITEYHGGNPTCDFTDIKLIEIIQEDTNQE